MTDSASPRTHNRRCDRGCNRSCDRSCARISSGFTLIELLVAITILAVVAVLGWRGLDGIVRARVALTENLDLTRAMQLTFAQMQSDCDKFVSMATPLRHAHLIATQDRLTMVRSVSVEDQPSRLQVVTYRLRNGALSRQESVPTRDLNELATAWQAAGAITDNNEALTLQSDVTAITMRFWQGGGWRTPPAPDATVTAASVPTGLEVSLQIGGRSTFMRKIFLLGVV
ncbi:MAG: prepilin-type N-terminal cleavage/methylation domain-containing protein [Pseudomonadota bacterium]